MLGSVAHGPRTRLVTGFGRLDPYAREESRRREEPDTIEGGMTEVEVREKAEWERKAWDARCVPA